MEIRKETNTKFTVITEGLTLMEIKMRLMPYDKTMTWMAQQLNFSNTYLYRCINSKHKDVGEKITKILDNLENGVE